MVDFLKDIKMLVKEADSLIKAGNRLDIVIETVSDQLIGTYYTNLLKNFFDNLNEENTKEYSLNEKDAKEIKKKFNKLAKRAEENFITATNKCKIYQSDYDSLKKELKKYKSLFKFLLKVERLMNKDKCDQEIQTFLETVEKNVRYKLPDNDYGQRVMAIMRKISPGLKKKTKRNQKKTQLKDFLKNDEIAPKIKGAVRIKVR